MIQKKKFWNKMIITCIIIVFSFGFACAGETADAGSVVLKSVDLSSSTVEIIPAYAVYSDTAVHPEVSVNYNGKVLSEGADFVVSAPEIINAGTYRIRITGIENYTGSVVKSFTVYPIDLSDSVVIMPLREFTTQDLDETGSSIRPDVLSSQIKVYVRGNDVTSWCNLTSSVYLSEHGNSVTVKAAVTEGDSTNVINSSASAAFPVKNHMLDCEIGLIEHQVFNNVACEPEFNVMHGLFPYMLNPETDYTVEYHNNFNAGFASVVVTGKGDYVGSISRYFKIEPKDIINCIAFYLNGRSASLYSGQAIEPAVIVRDGARLNLKEEQDFSILYTDNAGKYMNEMKEIGEYRVVISGIGNYKGKLTLDYEVTGTDISNYEVALRYKKVKADGEPKIPEILSVTDGTASSLHSSDYEIIYLDSKGNEVDELILPGRYTIKVKGIKSYKGSTETKFEIIGSEQEILLSKTSYVKYKNSSNFQLHPSSTGDAAGYTYVSSDPEVASVSKNGVVNVHKLGRAKITITTKDSVLYNPASKSVIVKVYPYKTTLTQKPWTDGKKSFRVRWNTQEDVTYYQVRYSTTKNFKEGTYWTKKVNPSSKNYATQSTKVSNLKSGKRFYVKGRAVKVVTNDAGKKLYYYGNWSNWKSVVTK